MAQALRDRILIAERVGRSQERSAGFELETFRPREFDRCRPINRGDVDRVDLRRIRGSVPVGPTLRTGEEASAFLSKRRINVLYPRDRDLVEHILEVAIKAVQISVFPRGRDHLSARLRSEQDGARCQIPIMEVVLDQLLIPAERTGPRVKHHDAESVKIVAGTI